MSFEGYYQALCKNGHKFNFNISYDWDEEETARCPYCNEKVAWYNIVDDTNCDQAGHFDDFEILTPKVICTCDKCKHEHVSQVATYKIPKNVGHIRKMSDSAIDLEIERIIKEKADKHRTCGKLPACVYLEEVGDYSLRCCARVVFANNLNEAIKLWNKSQRGED
jgi:hypothetical protein